MAGVGDEAPHAHLGVAGLVGRRLRGGDRVLDPGQHPVERQRQPAHLGARITLRDTALQFTGGDGGRGLLDLSQRSQAAVHHGVTRHTQYQEHGRPDPRLGVYQRRDRGLHIGEIDCHRGQFTIGTAKGNGAPPHM